MRIAFISTMSGSPWGGSERLWTKTAEYALKEGHSVLISVYRWPEMHPAIVSLRNMGAKVILRDQFNSRAGLFSKIRLHYKNRIQFFNREISHLLGWGPDMIIINQGESFDVSVHHHQLYLMIKRNRLKYSLICHSHSQYGDIPGPEIYPRAREIFNNAEHLFFVSKRMQQLTERKLCLHLPNASLTWNPLNISEPEIIPWPEESTLHFAVVANLGHQKGHDTLLECLSFDAWKKRNWQLNIYGTGYGEDYLKELAGFYNIEERVVFHGFENDVKEIWSSNHLLLIPSAGEGLPISLIEAMICGRPAVVTDVGGHSEVITEGQTGFIAEAPGVQSYARTMERAWGERDRWEQMGRTAHHSCVSQVDFNPEKTLLKKIAAADEK